MNEQSLEPVTIIVRRQVKSGKELEFEAWLDGVTKEALRFEGNLGANIIRPNGKTNLEYVLIFRFDSYEHLKIWEESKIRAEWLKKVEPITITSSVQKMTGLEYWFTLPDVSVLPPPRYKMVLVTVLGISPLSFLMQKYILPHLVNVSLWPKIILTSFILIVLMTYAVMPLLIGLLSKWLFPSRDNN